MCLVYFVRELLSFSMTCDPSLDLYLNLGCFRKKHRVGDKVFLSQWGLKTWHFSSKLVILGWYRGQRGIKTFMVVLDRGMKVTIQPISAGRSVIQIQLMCFVLDSQPEGKVRVCRWSPKGQLNALILLLLCLNTQYDLLYYAHVHPYPKSTRGKHPRGGRAADREVLVGQISLPLSTCVYFSMKVCVHGLKFSLYRWSFFDKSESSFQLSWVCHYQSR